MCGIAGIADARHSLSHEERTAACGRMADALAHRGPDDRGVWSDPAAGIALGHRRLSILDLSPMGHQPMTSESGRYVISYNGEIYNFAALRAELAAHRFGGHSDTEVALAAFEEWGVEAALPRFNGMFAIAAWDTRERVLWLARDRFGEKPLYYGRVGSTFVFASELKAFRHVPGFEAAVDRGALTQFLRFGYVPTPSCIFQGIAKLPPASYLRLAGSDAVMARYWSLEEVARGGAEKPFRGNAEDAADQLDAILRRAVALRMVADVPLGAFLSGGIDSSTVVALMQATGSAPARTFTIGFEEVAFDEAASAKAIATHLGTQHTELRVTAKETMAIIPRLPALYDEPFADASQVPTSLVAQLARRHVTVALSGDGGDELFGGYNWYFTAETRWRRLQRVPPSFRRFAGRVGQIGRWRAVSAAYGRAVGALPMDVRARLPADLLAKMADAVAVTDSSDVLLGLHSTWSEPRALTGVAEPEHAVFGGLRPRVEPFAARLQCIDSLTYLPDDILVKVDRAAMGVSLETRVPLLDPDVASFAWSLPTHLKMSERRGKLVLRDVLARYVPRQLFERPKQGFAVPLGAWLRGPLREWAESQLSLDRIRTDGFLDARAVRRGWDDYLRGMRNAHVLVWSVLMFQAWLSTWQSTERRAAA